MTDKTELNAGKKIICCYCDDSGWYIGANYHTGEAEQAQCESCDAWHIGKAVRVEIKEVKKK